ncbi:hypothetical protein KIW84_055549 [Lathyrus oleraceus]|uniref:Zeta toxin domain-containing protein n=1 Tax=Pisum sativum TaxID=3888 RepID=A0A9D5AJW8_PEA|nr:hypothetical protein KIW84_055549 [Pisum sativum]
MASSGTSERRTERGPSSRTGTAQPRSNMPTLRMYAPDVNERFIALSRAGPDDFYFTVASNSLLVLCDVRKPLMPILQGKHNIDKPRYMNVLSLSMLRSHSKVYTFKLASKVGFCINMGPFWNSEQMGFVDASEVPELCRLAQDYLRNSEGCFISQVLSTQSQPKINLKNMFLEATRDYRLERVTRKLKVVRAFSTLVKEIKAIKGDSQSCDAKVSIVHSERNPMLLLMGGGMGSRKSIVLKDILGKSFWSEASSNVMVVEADSFKESDVIYRALNSKGHHDEMLQRAELVHQSSTNVASSLLVTTLNKGRDVIMDGTCCTLEKWGYGLARRNRTLAMMD